MKKVYLFATAAMVAMSLVFSSCEKKQKDDSGDSTYTGQKVENSLLTPDQSQERLMHVAQLVTDKFNTADQKAAVNLADQLYDKYQDYDMNAFENLYEDRYESFFAMPRYAKAVLSGAKAPTAVHQHLFSFANESAVFEADERNRQWEYKGKADDNSLTLKCKDAAGNPCEMKMWGEGNTHRYEYTFENGSDSYRVQVDMPAKIIYILKQNSKELIHVEFAQELVKNDHAYLSLSARVTNISWTCDIKVNSNHGSAAYAFKHGGESLFSVALNLPSYKLIDKADGQSYEDWIEEYEDQYESLIKQIKGADAIVDIYGWIQLKANIDNVGSLYSTIRSTEDPERLVYAINKRVKVGLYYGSDIKQASVIAQLRRDDYYGDEYPEGVLYFEQDGTTYAFDQYFNRKPFTDLQYTIEDIVNAYINLSTNLSEEIGEVEF